MEGHLQKLIPLCPECGTKMCKAGFLWSGRTKVQRYLCSHCGRTTIKKGDNDAVSKMQ